MSARDRLLRELRAHPGRIGWSCEGEALSYMELLARAEAYAGWLLDRGVHAGDRIAVNVDSSPQLVVALLGHLLAGVVHVPMNTRYRTAEIEHILADSGATGLLVDGAGESRMGALDPELRKIRLDALPQGRRIAGNPSVTDDAHPALMIYTSGTTGRSKGVLLSLGAVVRNMEALTGAWGWTADDRQLLALPLFHVHGLCIGVFGALLRGVQTTLHRRFDAVAVATTFRGDAPPTVFMGVPTMYARLLAHLDAHPDDARGMRSARLFTSGSAPLPAAHHRRFEAATGHRIVERYGMSETLITLSNPLEGIRKPGSVGRAVPGVEVRIVDDTGASVAGTAAPGEIQVRGGGLMTGYWGLPDATRGSYTGDGWFRTGDVATVDDEGYVFIQGRRSVDILKSGGFKIAAREIEEVIELHARVREAAVFGVPDETWGQRIAVAVVVEGEQADPAALLADLAAHVRTQLADFKVPRGILVLEELPRNALGKLQKHRLIAQADTLIGT